MDNIDYKAKVGFVPAGDGGRVTIVLSFASESPSLLVAEACGAKNALVKDVPAKSGGEASEESIIKKDPSAEAPAAGTVDSDKAKATSLLGAKACGVKNVKDISVAKSGTEDVLKKDPVAETAPDAGAVDSSAAGAAGERKGAAVGGFEVVKAEEVLDNNGQYRDTYKGYTTWEVPLRYPARWVATVEYSPEERAALKAEIRDWLARFGALDLPGVRIRFEMGEVDKLGGPSHLVVGRHRAGGAYLVHKFLILFALWDDSVEKLYDADPGAALQHVQDIKQLLLGTYAGPTPPRDPWLALWLDLFRSVRRAAADLDLSTSQFYRRFTAAMQRFMDAMAAEFRELDVCSTADPSVDLDSIWHTRAETVGGVVSNVLMELATEISLNSGVYDRPELQRMLYLVSYIARVVNEISSIRKDLLDGCGSLLFHTMAQKQWSLEQTVAHFVTLHDDAVAEFDRLEANLRDEGVLSPSPSSMSAARSATSKHSLDVGATPMTGEALDVEGEAEVNHVNLNLSADAEEEYTDFLTSIRQHLVGANGYQAVTQRYRRWVALHREDKRVFRGPGIRVSEHDAFLECRQLVGHCGPWQRV